jgi:membrane protein YqaA with SNARE-associated domain
MSDAIAAAVIAAFASLVGSVLTYIVGIRSVRRSVSTSNGEPLGRVLEARLDRLEQRLDGMERSIGEVREWLAFREGRERPPLWMPRGLD